MNISADAADATVDNDDVIIVYEKHPTPEQVKKARVFQLPDTFYMYEDAPPCPGCIGCEDDDQGTSSAPSRIPRLQGKAQPSPSDSTSVSSDSTSPKFGSGILRQPVFSAPVLAKDPAAEMSSQPAKPSFLHQPRFSGFGLTPPSEGTTGSGGTGGDAGKSQLKTLPPSEGTTGSGGTGGDAGNSLLKTLPPSEGTTGSGGTGGDAGNSLLKTLPPSEGTTGSGGTGGDAGNSLLKTLPPSEGTTGSGSTGGDAGKSQLKTLLFGGSKPSLPSAVSSSVGSAETSSDTAG